MDYMREYEKWLVSPALTPEEHAELESIRGDEKEIRERFYGPLEFGTAGLRGTMKAGLHQMNVHVIRWINTLISSMNWSPNVSIFLICF